MTANLVSDRPKSLCTGVLSFYYTPGKGVKSLYEIVTVSLIFLSALQQGSSSMDHITGQETVLKAKMNTKCLDTDILHTKKGKTKMNHFRFSIKQRIVCTL